MINPLCGFCLVKLTKIVLQVLVSMHLGFQQDEIDGYLLIFLVANSIITLCSIGFSFDHSELQAIDPLGSQNNRAKTVLCQLWQKKKKKKGKGRFLRVSRVLKLRLL